MERGIDPQIFVTSRINLLKEFPLEKIGNKQSVRLFWLPHQTISGWSDLTTSPGYMGEFFFKLIFIGQASGGVLFIFNTPSQSFHHRFFGFNDKRISETFSLVENSSSSRGKILSCNGGNQEFQLVSEEKC